MFARDNFVPQARDNFVPRARDNFVPRARDNFVPQARDNFVPQARDNFVPQARDNFVPQARDNFVPQARDNFVPGITEAPVDSAVRSFPTRSGSLQAWGSLPLDLVPSVEGMTGGGWSTVTEKRNALGISQYTI